MLIITRYKAAKLVGINESVFSQMWKRHSSGVEIYDFFTTEGKIDIDSISFQHKYLSRFDQDILFKIKNPKTKKPPQKKNTKSEKKTETISEKKESPRETKSRKNSYEDDRDITEEEKEMRELARQSAIAKMKKDIFVSEKAEMELRTARAELAELQTIGEACIGYLIALNQELLDQPRGFIDELTSGIKSGKSKTELTDIVRAPATKAITDTITLLEKELKKYKRDVRSDK